MIAKIDINNFKSIVASEINLGRFNVMIGENGCGKSNVLEAIAMLGSASANKLDNEFFANRGIRVTGPQFMKPAFGDAGGGAIRLCASDTDGDTLRYVLKYDEASRRWHDMIDDSPDQITINVEEDGDHKAVSWDMLYKQLLANRANSNDDVSLTNKLFESLKAYAVERAFGSALKDFLIFSPEETILRRFDSQSPIGVLGRKGEGLFAYLKTLTKSEKGRGIINEIKENLTLLDWFDDVLIPETPLTENRLLLKDRYLADDMDMFDQHSVNEGFLFLLFYLTLFISDETPSFFALDNLGISLNPKLCRAVTAKLSELALKHDKQVIITTHNPATLDGLDLFGGDRLFVVRRNIEGHTRISQVTLKKRLSIPISEAWMKGMIGGLPENF